MNLYCSAAPSGLKARQGKHLISRQKKSCREQFPLELSAAAAEKTADSPEKQPEILHVKTISACADGNSKASNKKRQMKRESKMPQVMLHEKTQICKKNLVKKISRLKSSKT